MQTSSTNKSQQHNACIKHIMTYLGGAIIEPWIELMNDRPVLLDGLQADLVGPPDAEVHPVEKGRDPREGEQEGGRR